MSFGGLSFGFAPGPNVGPGTFPLPGSIDLTFPEMSIPIDIAIAQPKGGKVPSESQPIPKQQPKTDGSKGSVLGDIFTGAKEVLGTVLGYKLAQSQIASGQSGLVTYDANGRPIAQTGATALSTGGSQTGSFSATGSSWIWLVIIVAVVALLLKR